MARALRRGSSALGRRGGVHTDIADAFVRAEVIGWRRALIAAGGYAGARERGLMRTEGRDYVVRDGDVITIRVLGTLSEASRGVTKAALRFVSL